MPLNLDAIGSTSEPTTRSWTSKDALLYAVAVGAGSEDVTQELQFTPENSHRVEQQVLPTFAVVLGMGAGGHLKRMGTFNPAMLVHAEQSVELHRPIPPVGTAIVTGTLVDIVDKRSGALVVSQTRAVDEADGAPLFSTSSSLFIRGEGGFAPDDGPRSPPPSDPSGPPDAVVTAATLPQQALIYRLCGDRNPLHSDPGFAARAGFDRPILHGLCTYGFAGRALLHTLCGSDPANFRSMTGRFSRPVMPGQQLTTEIWTDGEGDDGTKAAIFRTTVDHGTVVIDRGRCTYV